MRPRLPRSFLRGSGCLLLLFAGGCALAPARAYHPHPEAPGVHAAKHAPAPLPPLSWNPGQVLLQGIIGVNYLSDFTVDSSGTTSIELENDEILPTLGGGGQWKLAGRHLDFGLEGFLSLSGRSDLEAFASSGGSTVVAFDVDLLVVEFYGGPFVSRFLGDGVRIYGGAGPLLEWVSYDQSDGTTEESADGSGGGAYARAGLEFLLPSRKLIGFGARWSRSSLDFDQDFGELELEGLELFVSCSYGLEPRSAFDDL
jgi:hypothetical protein